MYFLATKSTFGYGVESGNIDTISINVLTLTPLNPHTGESTGLWTEESILPEAGVGIQI